MKTDEWRPNEWNEAIDIVVWGGRGGPSTLNGVGNHRPLNATMQPPAPKPQPPLHPLSIHPLFTPY